MCPSQSVCACSWGLTGLTSFMSSGVGVAGTLIEIFVGAVVGKLHDYYQRIQDELEVRKVLETELQQLRTLELTHADHTLRASEGRFQAIAENSPDAIIITDSSGIITYCNRATESMFACGQQDVVGQHSSILLAPHVRESEATNRAAYMRAGEGWRSLRDFRIHWGTKKRHGISHRVPVFFLENRRRAVLYRHNTRYQPA